MCAGAVIGFVLYTANVIRSGQEFQAQDAALAAGAGALAGLLIGGAAVAVAAGAIGTTAGAVIAGAGAGIATGGGGYMAANTFTGNEFNSTDFGIAATVGAATGAAGPLVGTTMASARVLNGVSGVVQYEATYYNHHQELDISMNPLLAGGASALTTLGPYTKPSSLFGDMRPIPSDSAAYWRRLNGYDPAYYPNSQYARTTSGANLLQTTISQQVAPGLVGGTAANYAVDRYDQQ